MRILSMTAVFGMLDGQTLELHSGLNVLCAPNEGGKSTWCAFLTAMLYGLDSPQDRERYRPRSGKPMEGTLRILHNGRDITIRRRTRTLTPMGEFLAWETQTGQTVRELTAERCGQVLLGLEKDAFVQICFPPADGTPHRDDQALTLDALLAACGHDGGAARLAAGLQELQTRCRSGGTGRIPECQAKLRACQEALWESQTLQKQHDALCARALELEQELDRLENHRTALEWNQAQQEQQRLEEARADARTALMLERVLAEKYTDNPDRADAEAKIRQGERLLEELELSLVEPPESSSAVTLTAILSAVLLIAAVLMADQGLLVPCIVMAAVMLAACMLLAGRQRRRRLWYNIEQTRRQGKRTELQNFINSWKSQLRVLDELDRARENVTRTQALLARLESQVRTAREPDYEDTLTLDDAQTLLAQREQQRLLEQCREQLARLREQLDSLPGPEQLQLRLAQTRFRLLELEKTEQAILRARSTLEQTMQEQRSSTMLRISGRAGSFAGHLTGPQTQRLSPSQPELAVQLAVWEALAPDCPLILDDALARFDQGRMERAVDLLSRLAGNRQILLLSCQDRELRCLKR